MNELAIPASTVESPRPRWRSLFAASFVALLGTGLGLVLLQAIASSIGVVGWRYDSAGPAPVHGWPYEANGIGSVLANVVVAAIFAVSFALIARASVERRSGVRLSLPVVAVIAVLTAYLPLGPGASESGEGFFWALVLSAVGLRFAVAWGEPLGLSRARRRQARTAGIVVGAAALVGAIGYGLAHPLWFGTVVTTGTGPDQSLRFVEVRDGTAVPLTFIVHSVARFDVVVTRWETLGAPGVRLRLADPPVPTAIPGRASPFVSAAFIPECPRSGGIHRVEGVRVHYRLLSLPLAQPIRFTTPLQLVCSG